MQSDQLYYFITIGLQFQQRCSGCVCGGSEKFQLR